MPIQFHLLPNLWYHNSTFWAVSCLRLEEARRQTDHLLLDPGNSITSQSLSQEPQNRINFKPSRKGLNLSPLRIPSKPPRTVLHKKDDIPTWHIHNGIPWHSNQGDTARQADWDWQPRWLWLGAGWPNRRTPPRKAKGERAGLNKGV